MTHLIYVDGQEGTTGLRIHDYLAQRADIELLRIDPDKRKDPQARAQCLNEADVAFLCLPDAAAIEAAALLKNPRTCLIDASTAHRTHPDWVYGLPELARGQREALRQSKRIANPGCHATGFILLVRPLIDAGLLPADTPVSATSITGFSGGGKAMISEYKAALAEATCGPLMSPRPYGLTLAHKHLPEMAHQTGLQQPPMFMPVVGPFEQGLQVTIPLPLSALRAGSQAATAEQVQAAYEQHYAGESFIQVHPLRDPATVQAGFFDVQGANGSNRVDIHVFANAHQVLLSARLDNLGKGASGAAVQCMNIHLGVAEGLGL